MYAQAKRTLRVVVGLALAVVIVYVVFKDTNWRLVWDAVRRVHVGWLVLGQVGIALSFLTRVQRWTYIVRASGSASFRHLFSATQIGFMANFVLPARAGELVRALVLGRLSNIPFSRCAAYVALDRVTDLIGLLVAVALTVLTFVPPGPVTIPAGTFEHVPAISITPTQIRLGELAIFGAVIGVVAVLVMLYINMRLVIRLNDRIVGLASKRLARWSRGLLEQFAEGLHVFRSPVDMLKSIGFSLVTWSFFVLMNVIFLKAFDIDFPWSAPLVMTVMTTVFVAMPGAPGFVGQFHAPIILTIVMLMPDVPLDKAKAFAIVVHLFNVIWVIGLGMWCLRRDRLGLLQLSRESASVQRDEVAEQNDQQSGSSTTG